MIGGPDADADRDGDVDSADANLLKQRLNTTATGSNDPYDLNKDGRITSADLRKLTTLITKFEDESIGYLSKERPMFMRRGGGDYDHLARVKEWSLTGGAAEDAGDAE